MLDAAHILPDKHPKGVPAVWNGLSLCKLHHAAFDQLIMGIRPDHRIEIRTDILKEKDGPMLVHGLQGFDGKTISVPASAAQRPKPEFLEERFDRFRTGA